MLPNGMSCKCKRVDRRWCLFLLKEPHPRPPLRMERGVDSIICKQRGRFFDVKRRPFHCKETPSSNEEGRFLVFIPAVPANEASPRYTPNNIP